MVARTAAALLTAFLAFGASAERALEVEDAAGAPVRLALADGEAALVVHFWATWCPECEEELPLLAAASGGCGSRVRVVAVDVAEPADMAGRFLAERAPGLLPLLRDPSGRTFRSVARGLPANLIWTRTGRRVEVGPHAAAAWEGLLRDLGCPR